MRSIRARPSREPGEMAFLEVTDLAVSFRVEGREVEAVKRISFTLDKGETLAIVGESGSGKSVTALSILQLLPYPQARHPGGSILVDGEEMVGAPPVVMSEVRGNKIAMVFQEPMSSLNPLHTVEKQVIETLVLHKGLTTEAARARTVELLHMVGLGEAERRLQDYPHQLSGGQRQRVMIAMALSCEPKMLIADEATSALDVTIQAQILEIIKDLTNRIGTAVIIITHNLGVVARYADTVNVMYAGRIRETGNLDSVYKNPKHPYTVGLLNSVPTLDLDADVRLEPIRGEVPNLAALPPGCAFKDRCDFAVQRCGEADPELVDLGEQHRGACWEHERVARNLPGVTV